MILRWSGRRKVESTSHQEEIPAGRHAGKAAGACGKSCRREESDGAVQVDGRPG